MQSESGTRLLFLCMCQLSLCHYGLYSIEIGLYVEYMSDSRLQNERMLFFDRMYSTVPKLQSPPWTPPTTVAIPLAKGATMLTNVIMEIVSDIHGANSSTVNIIIVLKDKDLYTAMYRHFQYLSERECYITIQIQSCQIV